MSAAVSIRKLTGQNSSITSTAVSSGSTRLGTSDEATSASPVPVPTSGCNYTYWATFQLNASAAADNSLTNIKWWQDNTSYGTGIYGIVATASVYASAVGTAGSSGVLLDTTNHASLVGAPSPILTYTSACKLTVAGSIGATTGSFGNRVLVQLSVGTTGVAGNSAESVTTWSFDEA